MSETKSSEQLWYTLACTTTRRELKVRDDARRYGLRSFVPLKYEVKQIRGHEQRLLVPVLSRYIFVKGTLEEVQDYIANAHYIVYLQRSTFSNYREYLTVPTKIMEDFIAITEHNEEHITYFQPQEIRLNVGDQVRIKGGIYDGREGVIMRIKGKRNRHLVVQIPGVLIAAIEISSDMIDLLALGSGPNAQPRRGSAEGPDPSARGSRVLRAAPDAKLPRPSKNPDIDKKLIFDLAHRILFEISDKYQHEHEYNLLLTELCRTQARLLTFRGYTPATEAELALPLYLADFALGSGPNADFALGSGPNAQPLRGSAEGPDPSAKSLPSPRGSSSGPDPSAKSSSLRGSAEGPDPSAKSPSAPSLSESRLRKAILALKPSSLLRAKCLLYLSVLSKDPVLLDELNALFATWRKSPLSPHQRSLLEEFSFLTS